MNFSDWTALLLWPAVISCASVSGLLIWKFGARSSPGKTAIFALLACFVWSVAFLSRTYNHSLINLLDVYLGIALAGLGLLAGAALLSFSKIKSQRRPPAAYLMICAGAVMMYSGTAVILRDYADSKRVVEGDITDLHADRQRRGTPTLYVDIDGKTAKVTKPVYDSLRIGQHVHAEIGKGSDYVFAINEVSRASATTAGVLPCGRNPMTSNSPLEIIVGTSLCEPRSNKR